MLTERIGGQILINGVPKSQTDFGRIMGYVDKIEAYTPYMTVKETVAYSAAMRLGKSCYKQRRDQYVEEVIVSICYEFHVIVSFLYPARFERHKMTCFTFIFLLFKLFQKF